MTLVRPIDRTLRPPHARHARSRGALPLMLVAGVLSACSYIAPPPQTRGNMVDLDALNELVPGIATRADASSLLGSPTTKASFDDNRWIYIGERTRKRIASTEGVVKQEVVVLIFDDKGVLRQVKRMSGKDSLPVDVVERTTPTPGGHASLMQELIGNVGRFNPGLGNSAGPATGGLNGGMPNAGGMP
jgi:outer membrane protein assembly factor BamE (lipoprotein component of BamABCDE complex)